MVRLCRPHASLPGARHFLRRAEVGSRDRAEPVLCSSLLPTNSLAPSRCPAFKLLTYYGSAKERKAKRQGWSKPNAFHVCITSYTLVLQVRAGWTLRVCSCALSSRSASAL